MENFPKRIIEYYRPFLFRLVIDGQSMQFYLYLFVAFPCLTSLSDGLEELQGTIEFDFPSSMFPVPPPPETKIQQPKKRRRCRIARNNSRRKTSLNYLACSVRVGILFWGVITANKSQSIPNHIRNYFIISYIPTMITMSPSYPIQGLLKCHWKWPTCAPLAFAVDGKAAGAAGAVHL